MTNLKQQQIDHLNARVKTRLAPSKIHGVGLFALRDLSKGEKLFADDGPIRFTLTFSDMKKLRPEIREMLLGQWPNIINGSRFVYPTTILQAFCNHSETPNYDAIEDVMSEDTKAGEEITENYKLIKGYPQIFAWLT